MLLHILLLFSYVSSIESAPSMSEMEAEMQNGNGPFNTLDSRMNALEHSHPTEKLLDAAQSILYILYERIFIDTSGLPLSVDRIGALRQYLRIVSQTFPGILHRTCLQTLYTRVQNRAYLTSSQWNTMLSTWQEETYAILSERGSNFPVAETGVLPATMFNGKGHTFAQCPSITCATFRLLHIQSVNPILLGPSYVMKRRAHAMTGYLRLLTTYFWTGTVLSDAVLAEFSSEFMWNVSSEDEIISKLFALHNTHRTVIGDPLWASHPIYSSMQDVQVMKEVYGYHDMTTASSGSLDAFMQAWGVPDVHGAVPLVARE